MRMTSYKRQVRRDRIARLIQLQLEGKTQQQIADLFGVKQGSISSLTRTQEYIQQKTMLTGTSVDIARTILEQKVAEAANKIIRIMRNGIGEDRIQLDAAREILDRVGVKPSEIITRITKQYSPQEIDSALSAMKEIEKIENRVRGTKSRFLIVDKTETTIEAGVSKTAEPCGQEIVPEKPVLPLQGSIGV